MSQWMWALRMLPGSSTKLRLAVMVSRGDGPELVGFHRFKKPKKGFAVICLVNQPKSIIDEPLNFGSRDWCTTLEHRVAEMRSVHQVDWAQRALFLGHLQPRFMDCVKLLSYCSHGHWQSMAIGKYQKYHVQLGGPGRSDWTRGVLFTMGVFLYWKGFVQELLRT